MEGQKLMSQEKIQLMTPQAPFVREISIAELGFEIIDKGKSQILFEPFKNLPNFEYTLNLKPKYLKRCQTREILPKLVTLVRNAQTE